MSCKDCIHYEVCRDHYIPSVLEFINGSCISFTDNSEYVHLPCKVGDTVFYITGTDHNLIKSAKIKEIIIDKNGIKDLYVAGDRHNFENSFDILFLTREEAEKALKERKK